MKNLVIYLLVIFISGFVFSQDLEELEFIAPFHDGLAAVKKDGKWAFINEQGTMMIDFRDDLVISETENGNYPLFNNNRCIIQENRDGILYFGYINTCGHVILEPQFLNAHNFHNGYAIVLELIKEEVGTNEALGKKVSYDKYLEAIIDVNGNVRSYVSPKRTNVILDKKFLKEPPLIQTKRISDNLYAVLNENKTWSIKNIN